jgi:hypothetical protein
MRWRRAAALALLLAPLACGTKLRGVNYDPPPIDPVKYVLQVNTGVERVAALRVKSVLAANNAQAAAAQARAEKLHLEQLYVQTYQVLPELDAIQKAAQLQAADANEASKSTIAVMKQLQKDVKPIPELAKQLAVEQVKQLFKEKYTQLDDWRNKVLSTPWEKGQVAATKAAQPYFKMMGNFAASMGAYNLEAGAMRSQAAGDAANAKALADGVEDKKNAGDVIGAAQDQEMATALKTQSQQLAARAGALEADASQMHGVLPEYGNAARLAAWNAEYSANPDGLPPPPANPNFAYTPPPPPPAAR